MRCAIKLSATISEHLKSTHVYGLFWVTRDIDSTINTTQKKLNQNTKISNMRKILMWITDVDFIGIMSK